MKRHFGHSVSDYVLHNASCPVVICRNMEVDDDYSSEAGDSRRGSTVSVGSIGSCSSLEIQGSFKLKPAPIPPSQDEPKILLECDLEDLDIND